jgi:dTDP-4-amino-4,6-dideoxygalactose transaminase
MAKRSASQPDAAAALSFARPQVGEEEAEAVRRVLTTRWLTQGPEVNGFERDFAGFVGAPHACAVSSCTAALHMALVACGVEPGDEVITVSHSFVATANAIRYCGAVPVFVDIEPETYNISAVGIEPAISPRTKAIVCVHQMGMPAGLRAVMEIAERRGLKVVEDAACAAGSEILWDGEWQKIGRPHGHVACFSFHPRKLLTTGDGGMLTTADAELDARLHGLRQHAMSVPAHDRHRSRQIIFESYTELGFNYRMTDVQAAIGRVQLERLPGIVTAHRERAAAYADLLTRKLPAAGLPQEPSWTRSNWQSYCVRLPAGCDQRAVMQALLDRGIPTRRGIMCAHREPAYREAAWRCAGKRPGCNCGADSCAALAASEEAQDRAVLLPIHSELTDRDQETIIDALAAAVAEAS